MKLMNDASFKSFGIVMITTISIMAAGIGLRAQEVSADDANIDAILSGIPEEMPRDYSDAEIDRMLDDIQEVDDESDLDGRELLTRPELSDGDAALLEDIRNNPEKYLDAVKTMAWLEEHPLVIRMICEDTVWIDAHPRFAARIYLNYDYWQRHPEIIYVILLNRNFLVKYPRVCVEIYQHDDWFLRHPFIVREIYRNYTIFNRHPDLAQRYYRHHAWLGQHPSVMRIAYGNRALIRKHPQYLRQVYQFRRNAVESRMIREKQLKKIQARMRNGDRRRIKDTEFTPGRNNRQAQDHSLDPNRGRDRTPVMQDRDRERKPDVRPERRGDRQPNLKPDRRAEQGRQRNQPRDMNKTGPNRIPKNSVPNGDGKGQSSERGHVKGEKK